MLPAESQCSRAACLKILYINTVRTTKQFDRHADCFVKHQNFTGDCGDYVVIRLSRFMSQQCKLSLSTVCQVNVSEMNGRLNTSDPLDLTGACSTPTPTIRLTTIGRSDVVTTTVLNAVSASRSVANRPTTSAAGDATSPPVIIVWNFVTHNSTRVYKQFEYCAVVWYLLSQSPLTALILTSNCFYASANNKRQRH